MNNKLEIINKLLMNNKLAFGLIASVILLFIFMVNCSSVEKAAINEHTHIRGSGSGLTRNILDELSGKHFLLINGDDITVADAEVLNDIYKQTVVNATDLGQAAANNELARMNNEITAANKNIDDYKNLIGPGPNTVLGMPKNNGGGRLAQSNDHRANRTSWGSHGILGDLYRYRGLSQGNQSSIDAWGGTWNMANGRTNSECNTGGCNAHAKSTRDRSDARVKLRSDEDRPSWHNNI